MQIYLEFNNEIGILKFMHFCCNECKMIIFDEYDFLKAEIYADSNIDYHLHFAAASLDFSSLSEQCKTCSKLKEQIGCLEVIIDRSDLVIH